MSHYLDIFDLVDLSGVRLGDVFTDTDGETITSLTLDEEGGYGISFFWIEIKDILLF